MISIALIFVFSLAASSGTGTMGENKYTITAIGEQLEVGTRVHWDATTQNLYYVDVPTSYVYRYHPATNQTTKALVSSTNEPIGFAFPTTESSSKFIAALGRRFVTFSWDGTGEKVSNIETVAEVDGGLDGNRLNGGKVDPFGRLWAGTMGPTGSDGNTVPGKGSLYRVTKGVAVKQASGIGISNGLAWNVAEKKMYYIDTLFLGVYQYDYEPTSGDISNRKVIFDFIENGITEGSPDGLTIDTDGNLWVAVIWGKYVIKINPKTGKLLEKIDLKTPEVTAVSFGGSNLSTLYVNTAKMPINGKVPDYPAGCTFKIEGISATGLPGDAYKI